MEQRPQPRRHHFENQTSDIARIIELPVRLPHGGRLKRLLHLFLATLGELARRLES